MAGLELLHKHEACGKRLIQPVPVRLGVALALFGAPILRGHPVSWPLAAAQWYVDASVVEAGDGTSWQAAFKTIQEGIDAAADGHTVTVRPGIYVENIRFGGKNIILTSTDPLSPDVVTDTIIDGNQAGSVVTFDRTEEETPVLSGFTIRNGKALLGGGICGGTWHSPNRATIANNAIVSNTADYGGGLAFCAGAIRNNLIAENSSTNGGGLFRCAGSIEHNTIFKNSGDNSGGGLADCDGIVRHNSITYNAASFGGGLADCDGVIDANEISNNTTKSGTRVGYGGGLARCQALIQGNLISHNHAGQGGGLYRCDRIIRNNQIMKNWVGGGEGAGLAHCDGLIQTNIIADNSAYWGGGLFECNGTIDKNTISNNEGGGLVECDGVVQSNLILDNGPSRAGGGGLAFCDGTIQNNVIAGNRPGLQSCHGVILNNTIVGNRIFYAPAIFGCTGTIANCIVWWNEGPAGTQIEDSSEPIYSDIQDWTAGGEGNISEEPRFVDAERGDFRLRADSPCIDAGFNHSDLPEFDIAGMPRVMFGGKSPTVDMGAYEFYVNNLEPVLGTSEAVFTWSSLADKTYSIFYTDDLFNWHTAIANFASSGNETTSWTDDGSLTGLPPLLAPKRFYRVLEDP